jgi:predicted RNA-binding protein
VCEANAYIIDEEGKEILLLESVDKLLPDEGALMLENIFGERKLIKAKIKELSLVDHKIILERL